MFLNLLHAEYSILIYFANVIEDLFGNGKLNVFFIQVPRFYVVMLAI